MPWWMDIVLLLGGVVLWGSGCNETDDVWGLFQKLLGVTAVLVVILGGRQILLELAVLGLALWLPSATSRRLLSLDYRPDPVSGPGSDLQSARDAARLR